MPAEEGQNAHSSSSSRDRRYYTRLARREEVGVGSPSVAILPPFDPPATPSGPPPRPSLGFPLCSSFRHSPSFSFRPSVSPLTGKTSPRLGSIDARQYCCSRDQILTECTSTQGGGFLRSRLSPPFVARRAVSPGCSYTVSVEKFMPAHLSQSRRLVDNYLDLGSQLGSHCLYRSCSP